MNPDPGTITAVLARIQTGDSEAWGALLPLVYEDLHQLARAYMREDHARGILQPTALVNETYLRLLQQKVAAWKSRAHFFGVAALLMRRILVDEARRRAVSVRVMQEAGRERGESQGLTFTLEALDEALTRLSLQDPRQAEVVELRYFGGLTLEEAAEFLGVSSKTVKRDWDMARSWLRAELRGRCE
jgi:RNA polymerase sigma-70 factor (ECF subfamily)